MGRITTRSNPTNLREIPKERVEVSMAEVAGRRSFTVSKLDLHGLDLGEDLHIVLVARAAGASQRYELGTVALPKQPHLVLDRLPNYASVRFRMLIHEADSARLVASLENVRLAAAEDSNESVLPMQPDDLGQQLWKLVITEDEGPVLKYNALVFPTGAPSTYLPFSALVLPEALRAVLQKISAEPDALSEETNPLFPWGDWIKSLGCDLPGEAADLEEWREEVVERFAQKYRFASDLLAVIGKELND